MLLFSESFLLLRLIFDYLPLDAGSRANKIRALCQARKKKLVRTELIWTPYT